MKPFPNILVLERSGEPLAQRLPVRTLAELDYIIETHGDEFTVVKSKTDQPHPYPIAVLPVFIGHLLRP